MRHLKKTFFYIGLIGVLSMVMYWITIQGRLLEKGGGINLASQSKGGLEDFTTSLSINIQQPLAQLLGQIILIILVARLFGWLCTKLGQPAVIGEMFAGIVLGPSLLGLYFPEISAMVFPKQSLGNLQFLSQIGLILFMFTIGMELDLKVLKNQTHDAIVISHISIIFPFTLGMGLAYFLYASFAPGGVQFVSFSLFIGIAMSITAFPVLARIVQERGLTKTPLGNLVITCAAADDITAWCLLAAVIAIVKAGSFTSSLYTMLLAVSYVLIMIKLVRPFLAKIAGKYFDGAEVTKPTVTVFFVLLMLSAYTTEVIGIHALFGAFMAGAIMPDNGKLRLYFIHKVEAVAVIILLPLFFVFTGLRTQIGLQNEPYLWKITFIITVIAIAGKFLGSTLAAKFVGQDWKSSLSIGALMNARGLMELVVLNIGYDIGVLSPEIFSMLVLMALVTTCMTGPALNLIRRVFGNKYL